MLHESQQIGPYTLIRKIGATLYGESWLAAKQTSLIRTEVVLEIPEEHAERNDVKSYARLWAKASGHPNVVTLLDADEYDGQIVIASELLNAQLLGQWMKSSRTPLETAIGAIIQILRGTAFIHSRNVIHRRIDPSIIFLQDGTLKIGGFESARLGDTDTAEADATLRGTPAYMAPESFENKFFAQTDIWSIGVILYELATGMLPFPQKDFTSRIMAIISTPHIPLPYQVPVEFGQVIERALAKRPEDRYRSAVEMGVALQNVLQSKILPVTDIQPPPPWIEESSFGHSPWTGDLGDSTMPGSPGIGIAPDDASKTDDSDAISNIVKKLRLK